IAIADWGLDSTTGGLDQVSLVAVGDQATSLRVPPVHSPGYNAAVYGPPTAPAPTLGVVPSTTLASGTFTVAATVANPTFRPLRDASVALAVPSGWTVTPSSGSLGTVAPRSTGSVTFTVTAPPSGLTPGTLALLATASFDGTTLSNAAMVQVP